MPTVSWNARDASGELIDVQGDTDALVNPPGPAQLTQGEALPAPLYFQPTQPTGDITDGSIWVSTDDDNSTYALQVYSSGAGGWTDPQPATEIAGPEDSGTTVRVTAANSVGTAPAGDVVITAGDATGSAGAGGDVLITAGDKAGGSAPGNVQLTAGAGGTIILVSQVSLPEVIQVSSIPFADPGVFGQLWCDFADGYRVKVSEGP